MRTIQIVTFTFHYGKIKTKSACNSSECCLNLHSTMVRLKQVSDEVSDEAIKNLHSTMVRLKPDQSGTFAIEYNDLHSTMVRLKRRYLLMIAFEIIEFTFHYGKIKTRLYVYRKNTASNLHSTMVRLKPY